MAFISKSANMPFLNKRGFVYKSKYGEINLFNAIYNEDIKKIKELVNNKIIILMLLNFIYKMLVI
ncbi:unknown [Rickettsia conorii str. Malish 7]|uniref:Uncharacterized protein n=1 Tax=Rickettsia conorii (strain ATCC VR-613 / Malish 7) TaxID=272944 RepID=Q92FY9_RICCN|nr:unknown [Rickettsia conorii str. Malish 7]